MAVAVKQDAASRHGRRRVEDQAPILDGIGEQVLDEPSLSRDGLCPVQVLVLKSEQLVLKGQDAGRLTSHDGDAGPGGGTQSLEEARLCPPGLLQQALRDQGTATTDAVGEGDVPPGGFQQLDRRAADLGLGEAAERIGQEDHGTSRSYAWAFPAVPGGARPRRASREPPRERVPAEPR